MTYAYDRTAAPKPKDTKAVRESLKQAIKVLSEVDDYLYEGSNAASVAKALGVLTTAERLVGGVRDRLEKLQ